MGDIVSDGEVNAKDLIKYRKYIIDKCKLGETELSAII